jgi:uncharacterized membrane protein
VALEPALRNVEVLALLVLVRTFLSWAMAVEVDGRLALAGPRAFRASDATH